MKLKTILSIGLLFIIVASGSFWIGYYYNKKQVLQNIKIKIMRAGQNGLINPLLEYEVASDYYSKDLKLFEKPLQNIINQQIQSGQADRIAFYYRELIDGPWVGIHESQKFFPASLLKVPIMIAYFKQAQDNPSILQSKVTYSKDVLKVFGNTNTYEYFKPQKQIEEGKTYTVEQLITYMIIYSDNNAKNLLILNLDSPNRLFQVYKDLGYNIAPELVNGEEKLSVHDYASFFRILYNASYLNKEYSKKALSLLADTTFSHGLSLGIPNSIKISHKFGEYSNNGLMQLHDCGIVYYPKNPYILCIMTRGKDFSKLEQTIKRISYYVYKQISK